MTKGQLKKTFLFHVGNTKYKVYIDGGKVFTVEKTVRINPFREEGNFIDMLMKALHEKGFNASLNARNEIEVEERGDNE